MFLVRLCSLQIYWCGKATLNFLRPFFLLLRGSNVFTSCLVVMVLNCPFSLTTLLCFLRGKASHFFAPFFLLQGSNLFFVVSGLLIGSFLLLSKALKSRGEKRV